MPDVSSGIAKANYKGRSYMSDKKFFDRSIRPACAYCAHARQISGGAEIFCIKKGVCKPEDSCRRYSYDPLKRVPKACGIGRDYSPEDFKL